VGDVQSMAPTYQEPPTYQETRLRSSVYHAVIIATTAAHRGHTVYLRGLHSHRKQPSSPTFSPNLQAISQIGGQSESGSESLRRD